MSRLVIFSLAPTTTASNRPPFMLRINTRNSYSNFSVFRSLMGEELQLDRAATLYSTGLSLMLAHSTR